MAQPIQNPKLQLQPLAPTMHLLPGIPIDHRQRQQQQNQYLQHPQLQQRVPTMSLIPAKPHVGQGIPLEHRQRQLQQQQGPYLQHPYYYGEQTQPVVHVLYNPNLYQQQNLPQQQYYQPNNPYWNGGSPFVNNPKVFYPKSAPPGIINPLLNQHPNAAQKQTTTKSRSRPAHKHQSQSQSATLGRSNAGGRSGGLQKSLADCCLNRIRSASSIQKNNKGNQSSDKFKDDKELKAFPSKDLAKSEEKINQKEIEEKQPDKEAVKKELSVEKEEEHGMDNVTNSLFRRLFKSAKKSKTKKNESGSNDIITPASSSCSSAKKNGVFSRLFGGVESSNKAQSNHKCQAQDPPNVQTCNIDLDEVRQTKGSKNIQAVKESTIV